MVMVRWGQVIPHVTVTFCGDMQCTVLSVILVSIVIVVNESLIGEFMVITGGG